jgi:multimeric flavodoxin WrbA
LKKQKLIRLLTVSGSPVLDSSTEILLRRAADAFQRSLGAQRRVRQVFVRLNNLEYIPCQACGESPAPQWCFFEDDLVGVFDELARCDCLLIGSPIYFDSVSAQLKTFMDRCNCFRPLDFENSDAEHDFLKRLTRKRPGGMILVGGEEGWFEGARRSIAGFFKWVEVIGEGKLYFHSQDFNKSGEAADDAAALMDADKLGRDLADAVRKGYDR